VKNTGLRSLGMSYRSGYFVTRYSLLIAFLILVTGYWLLATPAEAQLAGKITKVEGRVDILRAGAAVAVPVKMGDAVNVGDILRTKSDGKAEITFIDNTAMTVGPRSRLGIDEYLYKPDEQQRSASLKIYRGRTGFQIPKPVYSAEGSKFEMKTKTAVAGVRGTEGIIHTDGVERVYVKEGVIEFKNPLGSVIVSKGEVGEVFAGRAPVERPYSEREYQQQEKQVTPAPPGRAEAPEAPSPPPAAPPKPPEIALQPTPPPDLPKIKDMTLNKVFSASASILDGEIQWFDPSVTGGAADDTAAVIQSGSIKGTFNQTILEGGYYNLTMDGSYAWVAGRSIDPSIVGAYNATDDWFHFFYSGSADGKPFYGASVGDIAVSNKSWSGGNIGWIEDGSKKYWYIGGLSGSYTNIFYNNNYGDRTGQSGTFSTKADGLFWDGSRPFWEVFDKIIPTLPGANPDVFVPITETAIRTFDINFNANQSLTLKDANSTGIGSVSVTSGLAGKGIELSPGSGLFDVNVKGNWSVSSGNITNVREINGTINGSTSINTSFAMSVEGGVKSINSDTAIVGAFVGESGATDKAGVMVGKMTGSTSGTFDAKAIGEIKSGFMLP
jgi:hypothetical protein